jgi:CPA1 family monovalent cation:H+ antiporter
MNGWHETYNDMPGPDIVCGHLTAIASPPAAPDPPHACGDCLVEGSTWVELRQCLVCGRINCCDSSPRRHATRHFEQTGHPVLANYSRGEAWGWCFVDGMPLTPDK